MVSRTFVLSIVGTVICIPAALVLAIKAYQPEPNTPVRAAQPVKPAINQYWTKEAEAEYQAQGGDKHMQAEYEAMSKPEALAANEYYGKFLVAKRSGATPAELCSMLQVAHLGYAEAGATDEVKKTHEWQMHYGCRQ